MWQFLIMCFLFMLKSVSNIFFLKNRDLQIRLAIKGSREWHVVECASWSSLKWWHSLDTIFSLIWRQFTTQLIRKDIWLKIQYVTEVKFSAVLERFTLSEAKILNESMTCSAVSVSVFSRVMKSRKASKCTKPVLFGSTTAKMRWKSNSPCRSLPME